MVAVAQLLSTMSAAGHQRLGAVTVPTSRSTLALLQLLRREGLVRGYVFCRSGTRVLLKYTSAGRPLVRKGLLVSKPGRPVPVSHRSLAPLAHCRELLVLSTGRGLLTLPEALQQGVGGFVLCKIL